MTDLEMTQLCAEAIGYEQVSELDGLIMVCPVGPEYDYSHTFGYYPLHDDRQAMELVKKFKLLVNNGVGSNSTDLWHVQTQDDKDEVVECIDLNRAIVECVAKMQKAKE